MPRIRIVIWNAYVYERRTLNQLSMQYKKSKNWIRARIAHANVVQHTHTPQPIVAIADVTFFKRSFGVLVMRAPHLKKNIYVQGYTVNLLMSIGREGLRWRRRDIPCKQSFLMEGQEFDNSLLTFPFRCVTSTRSRSLLAILRTILN